MGVRRAWTGARMLPDGVHARIPPGVPDDWARTPREVTALLVEFRAPDEEAPTGYEEAARRAVDRLALVRPVGPRPTASPGTGPSPPGTGTPGRRS